MSVTIGQQAPLFVLNDTDKNKVSLEECRGGNVVLLFFPLAFTGVCTQELCAVRDDLSSYNNLDAKVFAISVDSIFSLGKFKAEQNLNFTLLSDFNRETASAYGALYDEFVLGMKGVAKRAAFVIDKNGDVRYAEVLEDAGQIPDFNAIKEILAAVPA